MDRNGYTMRKRRALRKARRLALKSGFALARFRPGHDEPKGLPEVLWAECKLGRGWAMISASDNAEWEISIHAFRQHTTHRFD